MWSSIHGQNCAHLFTDKSVVIWSQTKVWSSGQRQKCCCPLTDKSVVIFSQTKGLLSTHRQKCGNLLTDKIMATCHSYKGWSSAIKTKVWSHYTHTTQSVFYAWTFVTKGSAKCYGIKTSAKTWVNSWTAPPFGNFFCYQMTASSQFVYKS